MAISATEREELRGLARAALGERGADLLMAGLGNPDLEERLALRVDLVRSDLRSEMSDLRVELKSEMHGVRGEFAELRGEFAELRGEVRGEIGALRGDMGELKAYVATEVGGIRAEIGAQTKLLFFALVTSILGIAGLVFSAAQLTG